MDITNILIIITLILMAVVIVLLIFMLMGQRRKSDVLAGELKRLMESELRAGRLESAETQSKMMQSFGSAITDAQTRTAQVQDRRLYELSEGLRAGQETLSKNVTASLLQMEERLKGFSEQNDRQLSDIRASVEARLGAMQEDNSKKLDAMRGNVSSSLLQMGDRLTGFSGQQDKRLSEFSENLRLGQESLGKSVSASLLQMEERLGGFAQQNEQQLSGIRSTVEARLGAMQEDNNKKLDAMRGVVEEKLQKTLSERLNESFGQVSSQLEKVYKGLGEMQTLAAGVGDLKKVLSNVKTRGIMGEIQLGAILEQILSPSQYVSNIATKKGSRDFVEYAIKLPGDGDMPVYLPIDAKFPLDIYSHLMDAYEKGDQAAIAEAAKALETRIRQCAKDIREKYIDSPNTTDFGILFLPVEGLYAEVVRRNMVETLSRDYKITVAGPTTMAALLNSLQMGFRTLALQKRSSEVWQVLGGVKTEFEKFEGVLESAQKKMRSANDEIDRLVGTRTRAIRRKLKDVEALPEGESEKLIGE